MKRSKSKYATRAMLAVPAAALMLGAAEAGSTIGLNFQDYYYANGGSGYQTTGMPVTGPAFGVPAAAWTSTVPLSCGHENALGVNDGINGVPIALTGVAFGGGLTANVNAPNAWQSGIGLTSPIFAVVAAPAPGNDQVTWGYISSGYGNDGANGFAPTVSISGLAAKFPDGYVIQAIASHKGVATFDPVDFTDGVTTKTSGYSTYQVTGLATDGFGYGSGTVGLSVSSGKFTSNTIQINPQPQTAGNNSVLAGFIITDKPVVTSCTPYAAVFQTGDPITLTGTAIGLGTFTYQWKHNGTNVGTNSPTYSVPVSTSGDAGDYTLTVTSNLYPADPATSQTAKVRFIVPITWDANTTTAGAQDGSGTWNNSTANWWDGTSDVAWDYRFPAIFGKGGTGPYTVTLGEGVTAGDITFASGGYSIIPTTATTVAATERLTFASPANVTANADATISAALSGSLGFNKLGSGTLTFNNSDGNNITGPVVVNKGTMSISRGVSGTSLTVNAGATVVSSVTDPIGYASACKTLTVNGGTFRLGISGNGIYETKIFLNNGNLTSVPGGVWTFGGGTEITNTGNSTMTGGTFLIRENNPNDILPITNSGNLMLNCPIDGGNRSMKFTGIGTTTFAMASTSLAKVTFEQGGTLDLTDSLTANSLDMMNDTTLKVKAKGGSSAVKLATDLSLSNFPDPASLTPNIVIFSSVSSTTTPVISASNIYLDNPIKINIESVVPVVGLYPLMSAPVTTVPNGITLGTLPPGITAVLVDDLQTTGNLYLQVTAITFPSLTWTGLQAGGIWDIGTTANWSPSNYQDGSVVTFDDSITTGTTDVKLNTIVKPTSVIFNNNTEFYTLSGTGAIAGATSLVMNGSATTTVSTNNTFTGDTYINNGTLILLNTNGGNIFDNAALELIVSAGNMTSSNSITGSGTFVKSGPDMLTVTNGLNLSSTITVAEGVMEVQDKASDSPYVIDSGATLKLGYSTAGGYANTNLKVHGDGIAAITGLYLKAGTTYNTQGTLELLDFPTTIRQYGTGLAALAIFDINGTGLNVTSGASGSVTDANIKFVSAGYGMTFTTEAGTETATGDLILNGPLDVNAPVNHGVFKKGAGSLRLNSPATAANNGIRIKAGSIICGIAECIGMNVSLTIDTGTKLDLNGFNQSASQLYFDAVLQAAGTWGAPGSGAQHTDTRFSGTGLLNVATGVSGYAAWSTTYANGDALNVDSDNDGVSNGIEYFMGDTNSGFTANPGITNGKVSWTKGVSYPGAYGTDYAVQTSPDLVIWTDVLVTDPNLVIGTTVDYTVPTGSPKLFTRLKVTGP